MKSRYKGNASAYSSGFFVDIVVNVIREGTTRRGWWKFAIKFDNGREEIVKYVAQNAGGYNIVSSTQPPPDLPPPRPSPAPPPVTPAPPTPPPLPPLPSPVSTRAPATPLLCSPPQQPQVVNAVPTNGAELTDEEQWPTVTICQILFLDEKHKRCCLGLANTYEWILCVDPDDPERLKSLTDGGVHESEQPETKPKYPKEGRALFGVMMTPDRKGRRINLFDYSERTVCSTLRTCYV